MHVNCPNCSTRYEIPALARPRRLRCAQCDTEWREAPAAAVPAPAVPVAFVEEIDAPLRQPAAPVAAPSPAITPPRNETPMAAPGIRSGAALAIWSVLWVLSLILTGGALAAFWHWRVAIGHDWAPALRLYRLIPGGAPA